MLQLLQLNQQHLDTVIQKQVLTSLRLYQLLISDLGVENLLLEMCYWQKCLHQFQRCVRSSPIRSYKSESIWTYNLVATNECTKSRFLLFVTVFGPTVIDSLPKCCRVKSGAPLCILPELKTGKLLLQGESLIVEGGCVCVCICCAKEFLIPKEYPVVPDMTTVQNMITKKLPISFFPVQYLKY